MANENSNNNIPIVPIAIIAGIGLMLYTGKSLIDKFLGDTPEARAEKEKIKQVLNADVFLDTFEVFWKKLYNYAKKNNPGLFVSTFFKNAGFNIYSPNAKEVNVVKNKIVALAKQIYDAKANWATVIFTAGIVNDQDNIVLGILQNCPTQLYVNSLNQTFYNLYNRSMIDYLESFLDDKHMARIEDYIKSKPLY